MADITITERKKGQTDNDPQHKKHCKLLTRLISLKKRLKWVNRSRNSKDRQNNAQNKKGQIQTMIYKTLHRKPKIE